MKRKAVAIVCALIIGIAGGLLWYIRSQSFIALASGALAEEMTKTLGTEVRVDSVAVISPTRVEAKGITLYDKTSVVIGAADDVTVSFRPLGMLLGDAAADSIDEITVRGPRVNLVKRPDNKWNISDLLENQSQDQTAFKGKVNLVDGGAVVHDGVNRWEITAVNGTLDFSWQPSVRGEVSLRQGDAAVKLSGSWGGPNGMLTARAENVDIVRYLTLLPPEFTIRPTAGRIKTATIQMRTVNGATQFSGDADLDGAAATVEGVPIKHLSGLVAFNEKYLYLLNSAEVYDQKVNVHGKVELDAGKPIFDVTVTAPDFDLAAVLPPDAPARGKVAVEADVKGALDAPQATARVHMAQGEIYGQAVADLTADVAFMNNALIIKKAAADLWRGRVEISGTAKPFERQYQMAVKGRHLDAAAFAAYAPGLGGFADIDAVVYGVGAAAPAAYGTASLRDGSYQGLRFELVQAAFRHSGERTDLEYATVRLNPGTVTACGTIDRGRLALRFSGGGVGLAQADGVQPGVILSGAADFSGTVGGTLDKPRFQAQFTAAAGNVFHQPYTRASGQISGGPEQIDIQKMEFIDGATTHSMRGSIGLTGAKAVHLTLRTRRARAENLVKLIAPGTPLTGNVDNEMTVTGTLEHINAQGHVKLTDGSYGKVLLSSAGGDYERKDGVTTIRNFVVSAPNSQMRLSGVVGARDELNFDVVADQLDIARMRLNLPYPATGVAKFAGKLTGTIDAPRFSGELAADRLLINQQPVEQVAGHVEIDGAVVAITDFGFRQGTGKYTMTGSANLGTRRVRGKIDVAAGRLQPILAMANIPPGVMDGELNGKIRLWGTIDRPRMHLQGNLKKGTVKGYPLDSIDVDLRMDGDLVTVNRFTARQGAGSLVIKGTVDLNGPLKLEIGGAGIDAKLLTNWVDPKLDAKGKLSFAAQLSGSMAQPAANVSLEVTDGGVGSATFDSLYGLLTLDHGMIRVEQVLLSKGPYRASAGGVIPLAALSAQGRRQADLKEQMDLKISLDEADLSILPLLTEEVQWASGPTKGALNISGTVAQPLVNGFITVENGALKLAQLADPFQKVALDIRFNDDKIELKTFTGHMGGGSFDLTGRAALQGMSLGDYHFALNLDKLGIDNKYFKGPVEGALTFDSGARMPKLAGKLLLENCTVDIPMLPDMEDDTRRVALDLEIVAGNKVRLYNSLLYDMWVAGSVKFAGSTAYPAPSGGIDVLRGTVSYLRTQFKIRDAGARFTQVNSFLPAIKMEADTKIDRTKIILSIDGPADAMNFNLRSEPAMSQQEIMTLLTLRSRHTDGERASGIGRDELLTLLDVGLQIQFLSALEDSFRNALNLDEFRFVRDTLSLSDVGRRRDADREVYNLEIGKYVTDKLMVKYSVGVGYDGYTAGLQYDVNNRVSLIGQIDEKSRYFWGIETRLKF